MRSTAKRWWLWGLVLVGAAVGLAFVPLFDLLAYEFSFVFALLASFMSAHLGASTVHDLRSARAPSQALAADARPFSTVVRLALGVTARAWGWLLLPLVIITLNALRVRNCAYASGLTWWAVLPMLSAAMGATAGVVSGLATRRRLAGTLLAVAIVVGSIVWAVQRFYAAPPIFAYDPFGGYFPGTLYDEEVAIERPLLWSRVYQLACATAALGFCAAFLDGEKLSLSLRRARPRVFAAALFAAAVALSLHAAHARLGFFYTAGDVARALGAEKRTPHFVLHYDPKGPFAKDIDLFVEDHELRWSQLAALFGGAPEAPVHAFLFDSAERKHELMGAAHTFIAKPWRREIYLQFDGWPHPVLMHELAHVFAGRYGDRWFGVSRSGVRLDVGLIEGVAVAADWHATPLTPDEAVKAMREAHLEPPLGKVMSLAFLGLNASQAYNLAGSFCHFLLEHHPARALEEVFHAAGSEASWRAAYGQSFDELVAAWSKHIDEVTVPARESEVLRERLRRPSVFHKVCAHELAVRRELARKRQAAGDKAGAIRALEEVCADDPDDPENLAALMDAADASGLPDAAARWANKLLAHPKLSAPLRGRAHALLGDLLLRRHALVEARAQYEAAAALPLDDATQRLTTAKLLVTREPPGPIADKLIEFFAQPASSRDPALDLLTLRDLVALDPGRPLFHYLFARQLEARGRFKEAGDQFDLALAGALPDEAFVLEAERLLGRARYREGRLDLALAAFVRLRAHPSSAARLEALDWLERIRFREARR
jgi:tetratricopeptide (TPR) repeat protein